MSQIHDLSEKNYLNPIYYHKGDTYYLYIPYQPVFDNRSGRHLYHEYVISYVSGNKILTLVKDQDFKKAIRSTIDELEKL